ncbi:MAG: hypothetical protein JWO19_5826 [Bryobacterales bacterium]|nr:hypothetical protein [Bryobacterales bacterium]
MTSGEYQLFHLYVSPNLAILGPCCSISVVEYAALVVGVVQLCAVGRNTPASSQKNLRGDQHA